MRKNKIAVEKNGAGSKVPEEDHTNGINNELNGNQPELEEKKEEPKINGDLSEEPKTKNMANGRISDVSEI